MDDTPKSRVCPVTFVLPLVASRAPPVQGALQDTRSPASTWYPQADTGGARDLLKNLSPWWLRAVIAGAWEPAKKVSESNLDWMNEAHHGLDEAHHATYVMVDTSCDTWMTHRAAHRWDE